MTAPAPNPPASVLPPPRSAGAGPAGSGPPAEAPGGFPTEALLAGQDAAAAELRAELDRLRRRLDEGPPPLPPARRRGRKPLLGVLVVGGTIGVIAGATLLPWSDLDLSGHSRPVAAGSTANHGTSAQPGAAVASRASVPAAGTVTPVVLAPAPRTAPAGSLPAGGPGIDAPGTVMMVQVDRQGDLHVVEQAVLGPRGLRQLDLGLPSATALGGAAAELAPRVHDLRVAVNGTPVTPTAVTAGSVTGRWTVSADAARARTVRLSYTVTGTVVRSKPSTAGRALALSAPLLGQSLREQGYPLVVRVQGGGVDGLSCPSAPAAQMLCGTATKNGWSATVPPVAPSPVLLLQLNLKH